MKKTFKLFLASCLCATIMIPFYPTKHVDAVTHPMVNVKLQNFLGNKTQFPIKFTGKYSIVDSDVKLYENINYTMKLSSGKIQIYENSSLILTSNSPLTLIPAEYSEEHIIYINGKAYLGTFKFVVENSYIRPINTLPMDDYLKGVVSYEMSNTWGNYGGLEALKAQAVAARTFALRYGSTVITDTQSHQVYGGYNWYNHTTRAVNETSGSVARYNGNLIEAFYSSSNGGKIFSNTNSWGSALVPYLLKKDDPYDIRSGNANVNWSFTLDKSQIKLSELDIANPYMWWNGVSEITSDLTEITNMKTYLQQKGYINSKYEVKITEFPNISFDTEYTSNQRVDGRVSIKYILRDKTLSQIGNTPFVMESGNIKEHSLIINDRSYNIRSMFGTTIMKSPYIKYVQDDGKSFTTFGGGWGHNIGMSQYGAYQMSKEGRNYKEILQFYYDSVSIKDEMAPFISKQNALVGEDNEITFSYNLDEPAYLEAKLTRIYDNKETILFTDKAVNKGINIHTYDASNLLDGDYVLKMQFKDENNNNDMNYFDIRLKELPKLEIVNGLFQVSAQANIYDDHTNKSQVAGTISPQNLVYTQKYGDWYMVSTTLGSKWVHASNGEPMAFQNIEKEIYVNTRVSLHDLPFPTTKTNLVISPQEVRITAQWNDWVRVKTWVGEKWINYIELPVEDYQKNITLISQAILYSNPTSISKTSGSVSPQVVSAIKKQGDWIQINTYLGPKWIKKEHVFDDAIYDFNKDVTITYRTTLYSQPDLKSLTSGSVSPQVVKASKKTGEWLQINTYLGPKWVKNEHVVEGTTLSVNNYLQLLATSSLHTNPNTLYKTSMHVTPQKVYVIQSLGNWHKIKTWVGDHWIYQEK